MEIATPNEIRKMAGLDPIYIRKDTHPRKTNCPNCGALIGMDGKCGYCGAFVEVEEG